MKKLMPLKPGDTLGICAPSARFDSEKLHLGIQMLNALGFQVNTPVEIFKTKRYLAGEDIMRANVIHRLFSDPDIDGIICARGGFGAIRILEHLDWDLIKKHPKPFVGFSDNTAILSAIIDETGNPVIHGPNVVSFADAQKQTIDAFYKTLTGCFDKIEMPDARVINAGRCNGVLKGGNLATLSHLLGTPFQPDFNGCILFFEDIGEPAYKIDRMLTQMKMAGLFEGIRGVVVGSFENSDNDAYTQEILIEVFAEYNVPVLTGLDSGHGQVNLSLCMGTPIKMDTKPASICWT